MLAIKPSKRGILSLVGTLVCINNEPPLMGYDVLYYIMLIRRLIQHKYMFYLH